MNDEEDVKIYQVKRVTRYCLICIPYPEADGQERQK
jgi:hypothetical protein